MRPAHLLKKVAPDWVKALSRPGFRAFGRITFPLRQMPNFLIVGTKRGGTTSMLKYLQGHPAVLPMWPGVENAKKTHFFDQNWNRGTAWYRAHFPTDLQRSRVQRRTGIRPITGEAAPYYMFHPLVLERISATIPGVKIIVLLRNPVDRVISHHNERVNAGTEELSFWDALQAEDERLRGERQRIIDEPGYYSVRHDFCSYLARGRYLEHLEPWLDAFHRGQLCVVRSEDMYADPGATLAEVHRFLGLPAVPPEAPHRFNYIPSQAVDPAVREWLEDYYRPHVHALERRLGRSFGWAGLSLPAALDTP